MSCAGNVSGEAGAKLATPVLSIVITPERSFPKSKSGRPSPFKSPNAGRPVVVDAKNCAGPRVPSPLPQNTSTPPRGPFPSSLGIATSSLPSKFRSPTTTATPLMPLVL